MAVCLLVKELSEFWGIDEVPIVGETQSIRGVNIERLRLRWCLFKVSEEELPQRSKSGCEIDISRAMCSYGNGIEVNAHLILRWDSAVVLQISQRIRAAVSHTLTRCPSPMNPGSASTFFPSGEKT